jgi:hypothetical protein
VIQALQVNLAKQAEHAINTKESCEQSVKSITIITEPEPELPNKQAIVKQLVQSLFLRSY